jgi:hypothetical protein
MRKVVRKLSTGIIVTLILQFKLKSETFYNYIQ